MVNAAAPVPHQPPGPQAPPLQLTDQQKKGLAVNSYRLKAIGERIEGYLRGVAPLSSRELAHLVYAYARGIDFALSAGDVPEMAKEIPNVLRKVYEHRKDPIIQSSILVMIVSCKNACVKEWFESTDTADILRMADELFGNFCTSISQAADESHVLGTILKVMPRYYPHLKFERLITSMEAKVGYDILLSDFFIERNMSRDEKIRLFVIQKENLEASSCITSPPHVSFLINGKGVDKRTNVEMETGPQLPTDITKMLKYGANLIQAVGYFNANYIIAIAFVKNSTPLGAPKLDDYAQPVTATPADFDVLEGPSRISLNCPISLGRIKIPIKGCLCKHYQCFDYDNYMEMNLRKPTWRCPYCNTPSNFLDLRIDQKMTKILQETRDDVIDVLIYVDESWKVVPAQADKSDRHTAQVGIQQTAGSVETQTSLSEIIDLMNEKDDGEVPMNWSPALDDTKPLLNQDSYVADLLPESPTSAPAQAENLYPGNGDNRGRNIALTSQNMLLPSASTGGFSSSSFGTLESILPHNVLHPVVTDAVSPIETSTSTSGMQHASNTVQLQSQIGPLHVSELRRPPMPRNPRREPVGIQALPVPQQNHGSSRTRRMQPNTFNCPPPAPQSSPNPTYQVRHVTNQESIITPRNNDAGSLPRTPSATRLLHRQLTNVGMHNTSSHLSSQAVGLPVLHYMGPQQSPAVLGQAGGSNANRSWPLLDQLMMRNRVLNQSPLTTSSQNSAPAQVRPAQADIQGHLFSAQPSQGLRSQAVPQASTPQVIVRAQPHLQPPPSVHTPQIGISDGYPELPVDENWHPMGRMRGSLTGSAYNEALERYMGHTAQQQNQTRPPNTSDTRRPH